MASFFKDSLGMEDEDEESTDEESESESIVCFDNYTLGNRGNIRTEDPGTGRYQFSFRSFDSGKIEIGEVKTGLSYSMEMPNVVKLAKLFELGGKHVFIAMVDEKDVLYISIIRFSSSVLQIGPRREYELQNRTSFVYSLEITYHHASRSLIILLGHANFFVSTLVGIVTQNLPQHIQEIDIMNTIPLHRLSISSYYMMYSFGAISSNQNMKKRCETEILKRYLGPVVSIHSVPSLSSQSPPHFVLAQQVWPNVLLLSQIRVSSSPISSSKHIVQPNKRNISSLFVEYIETMTLWFLQKCLYVNVVFLKQRAQDTHGYNMIVCSGKEGIEIIILTSYKVKGQEHLSRRIFIEGDPNRPIQNTIVVQAVTNGVMEYVLLFSTNDLGVSFGYQIQWDEIVSSNDNVEFYLRKKKNGEDLKKRKRKKMGKTRKLKNLKRSVAKDKIMGMMFVDNKQTLMYVDQKNRELFSS